MIIKGLQIGSFQSSLIGVITLIVAANSVSLLIMAESNKWYLASTLAFAFISIPIILIIRSLINDQNQGAQLFKILGTKEKVLIISIIAEWILIGIISSFIGSILGLLIIASSSQTFFERIISMSIIEAIKSAIFISTSCIFGMIIGIIAGVYLAWKR